MTRARRLTVVLTHPVQYFAPWWRWITDHADDELELTVVHAVEPTPEQQGVGFERPFRWDVPLTEGYRHRTVRPARPGDDLSSGRYRGLDVAGIGDAVLATRPEVVLVPGWYSRTLVRALETCRRAGIPTLYRGDSVPATPLLALDSGSASGSTSGSTSGSAVRSLREALRGVRARRRLRLYDGFLAVGTEARRFLERHGAPRDLIFDSPHAVDNRFFADSAAPWSTPEGRRRARADWEIPEEAFVVLFAGKLEAIKRPLDLVEAAARMGDGAGSGDPVHLLFAGSGPLAVDLARRADELDVEARFAGFLNQSEIVRAYGAADCLALPSRRETWGLVVNEALAAGRPAVVSHGVAAGPDLVTPGVTGERFPVGDIDALARALEAVRSDRAAGRDRAPACRERAAAHSFAAATEGLVAACRAVTGPRIIALCSGMVTATGLERMSFEVLGAATERGAPVHCLVNDWENDAIVALAEGIGAHWSSEPSRVPFRRRGVGLVHGLRMAVNVVASSRALLHLARRRLPPTHVFAPEMLSILRHAPALALLRWRGVRVVQRLGTAPPEGRFWRRLWRRVVAPLCDRLVANSAFTRRELLACGVPEDKVSVIENCVPNRPSIKPSPEVPSTSGKHEERDIALPPQVPATLGMPPAKAANGSIQSIETPSPRVPATLGKPPSEPVVPGTLGEGGWRGGSGAPEGPVRDPRRVVYVGQTIPVKGVDLLLDAAGLLVGRGVDVVVDVVGPIDGWEATPHAGYRSGLVERSRREDLSGRVRFLGFREDVPALLAGAAIHCAPSRPSQREAFGVVVLEAKAASTPSVVAPSGALPDLIRDGVDGRVARDATPEALADALEPWLPTLGGDGPDGDPRAAGRAARASLARWSRERFAEAWWRVFRGDPDDPGDTP